MPAQLTDLVAKGSACGFNHITLRATRIRHNRVRTQVGGNTLKNLRHLPDRCGHQDQIGFANIRTRIDADFVDDAEVIRGLQAFRRTTKTDNLIGRLGFKAAGKRCADQPNTEYRLPKCIEMLS